MSEWYNACTSGAKYAYPYGNKLNTTTCWGEDVEEYTTWELGEVGHFAGCHSFDDLYAEVYDMSGNAEEWDNSCDGNSVEAGCWIRGGSYQHNEHGLRCAMAKNLHWPRMQKVSAVGIRFCAN